MAKNDAGVTFDIKGGKELEKTLLDLAKEYGPRNVRNTVNKPLKLAIQPVTNIIKRNTPVDSGQLLGKIETKTGRGTVSRVTKGRNKKGFSRGGVGKNIFAAVRTGWFNANYMKLISVEYGNVNIKARNVIVNALRIKSRTVITIFFAKVNKNIEKSVKRLSNRKKLGKLKIR